MRHNWKYIWRKEIINPAWILAIYQTQVLKILILLSFKADYHQDFLDWVSVDFWEWFHYNKLVQ